jgi:uncharacterized repeat protein (TIGR03803 family)
MKRIVKRACAVCVLYATTAIALPAQTFTTLHSFDGTDGESPGMGVQATDGNFYGVTSGRGANNHGTIFKITPSGSLTTLYSFCSNQAPCRAAGVAPHKKENRIFKSGV